MERTVFMTSTPTNYKMKIENKKTEKKIKSKIPASRNIIQIYKLNYRNNCLNNKTTHLLYKNRRRTPSQSPCRNNFDRRISPTIPAAQTNIPQHYVSTIHRLKQKRSFGLSKQHLWLMLSLLITVVDHVQSFDMTTNTFQTKDIVTSSHSFYSQLLSTNREVSIHEDLSNTKEGGKFRPFMPRDPEIISHNVFTPSGKFRVFQPTDTDLRSFVSVQHKSPHYGIYKMPKSFNTSLFPADVVAQKVITNRKILKENVNKYEPMASEDGLNYLSYVKQQPHDTELNKKIIRELEIKHELNSEQKETHQQNINAKNIDNNTEQNEITTQGDLTTDLKSLEHLLVDFVTHCFKKGHYEPMPGLLVELEDNHSHIDDKTRTVRQTSATDAQVRIDLPRTLQTGRLLFLTGLKKMLWPVFMGLQVLKSLLIAMFIPALIGSFTKLLGKGITTGSAPLFIRPVEPPQELDFRDNTFAFEEDNKFLATDEGVKVPYAYNQPDTPQMHNDYVFDPSPTNNQLSYTRLGMNERQHQLMQDSYMSALQSIGSASFKNSGSLSSGSSGLLAPMAKKPPPAANVNTFQQFQNVPDSSLLLSNYDPFYSPLLSRLDSVFAQLKINSDKEICREKLICLMYANPAKYAPYSNLVSAQLSRELNELRKPTSDNPDILRFFKYMRAAKDGQDGVDCEKTFDSCTEFKDFDNPAMVSTYHDINKLVQARKLSSK